jgi:hypothetical protein
MCYKVHSNKQFLTFTVKDTVTKIHHHPKNLGVMFAVLYVILYYRYNIMAHRHFMFNVTSYGLAQYHTPTNAQYIIY